MLEDLLKHLSQKSDLDLEEMVDILWKRHEVMVSKSTISRRLSAAGWSRKTIRRRAMQQDSDLRDMYMHDIAQFKSYHLI